MKSSKLTTRRLTLVTMLTAMAIIANLVESAVTLPIVFPGVRLGLANVFGIIALYMFGEKEMLGVNLMRVLLASLLSGRIFGYPFFMSLTGVMISSIMVIICKRWSPLSVIGINCVSSTFHGVGQIIVVMFIMQSVEVIMYLGIMILLGIPTGLLTGYIAQMILKRFRKGEVKNV